MKKKPLLVPISERALFQRLSRTLGKKGERLKSNNRPGPAPDIGNYFIVSLERMSVVKTHVDLEELARELGILKPYERVEISAPAPEGKYRLSDFRLRPDARPNDTMTIQTKSAPKPVARDRRKPAARPINSKTRKKR